MQGYNYHVITPDDKEYIELIAEWYFDEWSIPVETTIEKVKNLSIEDFEFQMLMTQYNQPIATGGLYKHVGILDKLPQLKVYKHWLALVYTKPGLRGRGIGALICNTIQEHARTIGLKEIHLFTHTAENLYKRLGWKQVERHALGGKDIVVMKKEM